MTSETSLIEAARNDDVQSINMGGKVQVGIAFRKP
jgi:hypothetical protein